MNSAPPANAWRVAALTMMSPEELAALLQQEGATIWRCPLLSILDAPDSHAVEQWIRDLIAGQMGLVVFMTGEHLG